MKRAWAVRDAHRLDARQRHALAQGALVEALEAENQRGALVHQQQTATQQITHGSDLTVAEMTGGQKIQAQQLREEVGIRDVVRVFHPAVGLHRGGVGEHDVIAVVLQTVHQPIPVEGGFNGDGGDAVPVGLEQLQDGREVAGQFLVNEATPLFIPEAAEDVVAVQVNSNHDLHSGSPVDCRFVFEFPITPQTTHPPAG